MNNSGGVRERCQEQLLALRLQTYSDTAGNWSAAAVSHATKAVVDEVDAALSRPDGRTGNMLRGRVSRLAAARDAAVAAARDGTEAELHRELLRFEALTAAIWVVHDGLKGGRHEQDRGRL